MTEEQDWNKWYQKERLKFEQFTAKLAILIADLLASACIENTLEYRTKTIDSFNEKINRDEKIYNKPSDVTDLSALRIIVKTKGDLEKVSKILRAEFQIDPSQSVNKSDLLESNEFGYLSEHYVLAITEKRATLTEWVKFANLYAEIQVRTILQHAWATIAHSIEYKTSVDIPKPLRRRFYRLSALFELADDELDAIVLDSMKLYTEYQEQMKKSTTGIDLNVDSLKAYLESSEKISYWSKFIEQLGVRINRPGMVSRDVVMANRAGLSTIDDIDNLVDPKTDGAEKYLHEFYKNTFGSPDPKKHSTDINGIVTLFLIGKYQNIFTNEILDKKFGWGKPERATVPAKKYIKQDG
ncbi:MAG: RelA/SpoT domain-containing protein [Deltaproteobacteria bacterium]|nr:RelA/SpoT domain-containing protein [Deltaproteobacteria bacterium]